eukprot:Lankesteria_metandrocarpae@DN9140_c0_g1_i1.p1
MPAVIKTFDQQYNSSECKYYTAVRRGGGGWPVQPLTDDSAGCCTSTSRMPVQSRNYGRKRVKQYWKCCSSTTGQCDPIVHNSKYSKDISVKMLQDAHSCRVAAGTTTSRRSVCVGSKPSLYAGNTTGTHMVHSKVFKRRDTVLWIKTRYSIMALLMNFFLSSGACASAPPNQPVTIERGRAFELESRMSAVEVPWCASQWVYGYEEGQDDVKTVTTGITTAFDCQQLCVNESTCDFWEVTYKQRDLVCRLKTRDQIDGALNVVLDGTLTPTPEVTKYCNYQLDLLCNSGHYKCGQCSGTYRCVYWSNNSVSGPKSCGEYQTTTATATAATTTTAPAAATTAAAAATTAAAAATTAAAAATTAAAAATTAA